MEPIDGMMDMGVMFALRAWPLSHVFHSGCTFAHYCLVSAHKLRAKTKLLEKQMKDEKKAYDTFRT
jgi:hypothetical protein